MVLDSSVNCFLLHYPQLSPKDELWSDCYHPILTIKKKLTLVASQGVQLYNYKVGQYELDFQKIDTERNQVHMQQIKKYFDIDDEDQLQVSITGQQKIKCHNLKLKKDVVNKPTSSFHVQQLHIKYLQIAYDKSLDEPLKVSVDGITLVLTFNHKVQRQPPQYTKTQEILKAFHEAINKKEVLQRGYFWLQFSQIQKLLLQAFIGRLSLVIKQVDVSLEYKSGEDPRVIGAELGQINIKQRMVISHAQKNHPEAHQDEIRCEFKQVSLYMGISAEYDKVQSKFRSKQIVYRITTIKKNYLMVKNQINLSYNFSKGNLTIQISQLALQVSKLTIYQLSKISQQLSKYLSDRPLLKPHQGNKKVIQFGMQTRQLTEGTLKWWQYLFDKVTVNVSQRKNNFFTNSEYRKYMFFLFYKYTFGSNHYIEEQISKYQENKIAASIMEIYYSVLNKIKIIQESKRIQSQEYLLVLFLQTSTSVKQAQKERGLRKIKYDDIKNSKIFFNIDNCRLITDRSSKNWKKIQINVDRFKLNIIQYKHEIAIIEEGFKKLSPSQFYSLKPKYIDNYYKATFQDANKSFNVVLKLEISKVAVVSSRIQFKVNLPEILLSREDNELILKIHHLVLLKENKSLFNERNTVIIAQKTRHLKINFIYLNIHDDVVRHLLTIKLFMSDDITKALTEKQDFEQYLFTNVYKKLSLHPIFQKYKDESFMLQIQKMFFVSSLFTKNQYLTLQIGETVYNSPMQGKSRLTISKANVYRSGINNIQKLRHGSIDRLLIQKESTLMESNKPLVINIEKYPRGHLINSQEKLKTKLSFMSPNQKIDKNHKDMSYIYHQPVIDIVVPFILVQISFLDIFYFQLMLNYWKEIINNPYFFPKRSNKTQLQKQLVKFKDLSIQYIQKEDSFTRVSRTRCKFEGIEIVVYGQNRRQPDNRMIAVLLEGITFQNKMYILGQKTKIIIMNMFVQNCLGNKVFNTRRLQDLFSDPNKEGDQLIFPPRSGENDNYVTQLILYGYPDEKDHQNLFQLTVSNHLDLKNLIKTTSTKIAIKPLFLYQEPQFYQIIKSSLQTIFNTAKANYRPRQVFNFIQKSDQIQSDGGSHQILQAKNITEQFQLQIKIARLNILALHNAIPIFTISFLDVLVKHHTQLYVTKYHIKANQFYVVDISPLCGLHPIVMKSKQMNCYFTNYESDLLRQKEKKSSFLKIKFDQAQIHYLNRKIKQFTNFVMSHFKKNDEEQPNVTQPSNKKIETQQVKSYPFRYKIEMINPIIMLLRNSLSPQKFAGEASSIILHNIQEIKHDLKSTDFDQDFFVQNEIRQFEDSFQSCLEINEQQIEFYPFTKEGEEDQQAPSNIFISVKNLNFFPQDNSEKAVIYIPEIIVTMLGKQLTAIVPKAEFLLTQNDYRLLIRITEQNFSEVPVSFPSDKPPSDGKILDFQSNYNVERLVMILKKQNQSQIFGQLTITHIRGTNKLFSNGQKLDEITLQSLGYQSYFKNQLKTIIKSKRTDEPLKGEDVANILNQMEENHNIFNCKDYDLHQSYFQHEEEDEEDLNAFFKTVDGLGFKFGQKNKQKLSKRKNQLTGTQNEQKQEKKLEKVGKWVGGMCQKCLCCFRKKEQKKNQEEEGEAQLIKNRSIRPQVLKDQQQNQQRRQNYPYLDQSLIESESQMIKSKKKIDPITYHKWQKIIHPIYMQIIGQKNKSKKMYMLVQSLVIYYESKQHVMELINFMNKPYAQPEKPQYIRDSKFNNHRPFQMLVELTNTSIEANHIDITGKKAIKLDVDMIYNFQKQGDQERGPGRKIMSVDMLCQMNFLTSKNKDVSLSNKMRIIWQKQTKTAFNQQQPKKNKEKLYMYGVQKQPKEISRLLRKEKQKKNPITNPIVFKLPISNLKQLNQLVKSLFPKKQPPAPVKEVKPNSTQKKGKKMSLSLAHTHQQFQLKKKSETTHPGMMKKVSYTQPKIEQIIVNEEKLIEHKNQKLAEKIKNIKIYFVPKLTIEIQVGETTSYLTTNFLNIKYHVLEGCGPSMNAQCQTTNLQCNIDYFNLNLVKNQPFLQKTNVQLVIQSYKMDDNENKSFKVLSKSEKDKNSRDYRKGLSINLSTALYHTLKELHLKFQLGNESMETWGELCFNLTQINTLPHEVVLQKRQLNFEQIKQKKYLFQPQPPGLKNFFGKKFEIDNRNEINKKKSKKKNELKIKQFHIQGLRVFLYDSFIENATKLKKIIYRTPFRFMNLVSQKVGLKLNFRSRRHMSKWEYCLNYKDYYCLPSLIYENDFLVNIQATKKQNIRQKKETTDQDGFSRNLYERKQSRDQQLFGSLNSMNIRSTSIKDQVKAYQSLMSVKYLSQINAKIDDYHLIGKNKFHQYLFSTSNLQNRYIDKRDILIRSNDITLVIINVKSDCDQAKDGQSKKNITFYDSLSIIISPIIIYNYTNFNLGLTICRKNKKIQIPKGKKIQINQFIENIQFKDITLQFAQDIVHHQYRFFDPQFQVDPVTKCAIKKILIDRMQSLNVKIIKQTYSTCILQIFPDWVIINKTQMEFQLEYNKKEFPIDKNSASSLAVDDQQRYSKGNMKIKLYDNYNPSEEFHKLITETETLDIFTLVKVAIERQVSEKKMSILKQEVGCCGSSETKGKSSYQLKHNDEKPYKCIQFVVSIFEGSQHELTRQLVINYKYEVINSMPYQLNFYQASGDNNPYTQNKQSILLFTLKDLYPSHYLYSYDFLPKIYYIVVVFTNDKNHEREEYISNFFACDARTGQSFSLKLKSLKSNSAQTRFVRVDLNQSNYTNELNFKYIDQRQQQVKHPFYIKNATSYQVKITENDNTFALNNNIKSPFLWSNLINNNHKIKIEIQGVSKEYSMKQNSQFQPIVIRGDKINNQLRKVERNLFKRQICKVKWGANFSQYQVIYDIFSKQLHIKGKQQASLSETFEISKIERIKNSSNKIELIFKSNKNKYNLEIFPSQATLKDWIEVLSRDIENDIIDKIYFTIESLEHSMIFFIHNVDISSDNNLQQILKEYVVENLYVSIIYNSSHKVQELLLINMEDIEYITQERVSFIKYKKSQQNNKSLKDNSANQNYKIKKFQECFKIKKLKINNQLLDAVNPVILSQIKKSKYPFLQYKTQKQTLIEQSDVPSDKNDIQHYKTNIFFLDQAELIIQASLFPKLRHLKKFVEDINKNYRMQDTDYENLGSLERGEKKNQMKQIYINYMEIMPIKMTISVNFESAQAIDHSSKLMNFLTLIPAGVQNAIITIDSFIFHHVFLEDQLIKKTLQQYYIYEMKKQIVYNAGSIQFFAPLQIIQGLGIGFTNIFYNPLYSLVNNPEIETFTSNFLEGIITFFVFLVTTGINFVSVVFKIISVLSFDRLFQSKREMFKKQIFKSPIDGFNYGGRYFIKILKQFWVKFSEWPCYYHKIFPCLGLIFGFFLAIINIFPWFIKVGVTLFDFFYVVFQGFINWGHYQENSMKYRSRPIRTFPHKQLLPYDYLTAKGNEIMRKHQIQQNDNQAIAFISFIDEADQSRYIVLSNYRILYCTYQLLSFKEIRLYQISKIVVQPIDKDLEMNQYIEVTVYLQIPEKKRNLCFEQNITEYTVKFSEIKKLKEFLNKLINIKELEREKLFFQIDDTQLKSYETYKHQQIAT